MESQRNCWEVVNCGQQQGCPAYPKFGRDCFAVTGTICRGEKQGTFDEKIAKCRSCDYYQGVMEGRF